MKYHNPRQIGNVLSKWLFVVKLISKNSRIKMIVKIMSMTVANQNPNKKGEPIDLIVVIYTRFLNCLTALDAEILFFLE